MLGRHPDFIGGLFGQWEKSPTQAMISPCTERPVSYMLEDLKPQPGRTLPSYSREQEGEGVRASRAAGKGTIGGLRPVSSGVHSSCLMTYVSLDPRVVAGRNRLDYTTDNCFKIIRGHFSLAVSPHSKTQGNFFWGTKTKQNKTLFYPGKAVQQSKIFNNSSCETFEAPC